VCVNKQASKKENEKHKYSKTKCPWVGLMAFGPGKINGKPRTPPILMFIPTWIFIS
jgi:hypothetical protein